MRMPFLAVILVLPILSCGGDGSTAGAGGGNTANGRFVSSGTGVLMDTQTGFSWQQSDDNVRRNWDAAIAYCQNLSLIGGGWELPDVDDLAGIVNTKFSPTVDPAFSGTNTSNYWSSSPSSLENIAWSVNFLDGRKSNAMFRSSLFYCRCVRK